MLLLQRGIRAFESFTTTRQLQQLIISLGMFIRANAVVNICIRLECVQPYLSCFGIGQLDALECFPNKW